jgi:hypothetical protein
MGGSSAFALGVAILLVGVIATTWAAVEFVVRSRRFAHRPELPLEDRPPVGLSALRPGEIAREVESGLATLIGYLRRRTVQG